MVSGHTGIEMVRGNSNRLIRRLVVIPITVLQVYLAVHLFDLFTTLAAAGGPASGVSSTSAKIMPVMRAR